MIDDWIGLDRIDDWIDDWIGLEWIGLDWIEDWIGLMIGLRIGLIDDWIGCSSFDLDAAQPSTLFGARRCRRGRGGSSRSGTRSSLSLQSLAHTLRHPPNVSTPLLMYQRRQLHMRTLCDDQWRTWHGLRASKQAKQAMSVCVYGSLNRSRRTFRSSTPGGSWHTTCTPRASRS